ncbi:MAG TPA: OST-HTH/LOTUS domain-containing protein [Allosphingosinicella sp.]
MNSLWMYFHQSLFPDTRDVLPDSIISSVALAVVRAGLAETHPYLLNEFDTRFIALARERKQDRLDLYADCTRLNEFGFLMGPFVREVDHLGHTHRFNAAKEVVLTTVRAMIDHMLAFQPILLRDKPAEDWKFKGPTASYAFLLVSRPPESRPDLQNYVNRAVRHAEERIDTIYVMGRSSERNFMYRVLEAIASLRGLKGRETFALYRDYWGEPGGIAATFTRDPILKELTLSPRKVPSYPAADDEPGGAVTLVDDQMTQVRREALTSTSKEQPLIPALDPELTKTLDDVVVRLSDYEGAWITLAELGNELRQQIPGFTPSDYGERNLMSVLKRLPQLEFDEDQKTTGRVCVRVKSGYSAVLGDKSRRLNEAGSEVAKMLRRHSPGWTYLAQVGLLMRRHLANFDYHRFGFSTLHDFIEAVPCLEMDKRGEGHSNTYVRVRDAV